MKLVDSSVWIDHIRKPDRQMLALLARDNVCVHPFITGEILLGSIANRRLIAAHMDNLPQIDIARNEDVRFFIDQQKAYGRGIGWIDATLLVCCQLRPEISLLTRDKRLHDFAMELGLA